MSRWYPAKNFYAISDNITWPAHAFHLPTDVYPGETFQLAFVMDESSGDGFINATSSEISVYNARVQGAWDTAVNSKHAVESFLGTSVTFNCIGSTQDTNARDNAAMGSGASFKGVYKLEGTKIADALVPINGLYGVGDDNHGMYNGGNNKLDINQNGGAATGIPNNLVWTGSIPDGTNDSESTQLGSTPAGVGDMDNVMNEQFWIDNGMWANTNIYALYALSEVLTWPSPPLVLESSPPLATTPPPVCMVNGVWDKYQKKSPYGRWNNTNTNHKLFPMTICNGPGGKIIRKQTKNLYINTAARMSKKQTYSFLIRNGIGPYTR